MGNAIRTCYEIELQGSGLINDILHRGLVNMTGDTSIRGYLRITQGILLFCGLRMHYDSALF